MDEFNDKKKSHRQPHAGRKAERKANKKKPVEKDENGKKIKNKLSSDPKDARNRNPKAFAIQNVQKTERRVRRKEDITAKRTRVPEVDRTPSEYVECPPYVVAIVGPPKVGKSTLLRCLVKNFTRQSLSDIHGPVTIVSGKKRRLTLLECAGNDINSMIDVAKVADLVLLLVDASFGFEMEVFEFLNICQVHGFPRIMGVLTHLDSYKNNKVLQRTKKIMKHRFWTEVYQGAKLFYLSGMVHGEYQKTEVHNLGRFISVMKFRPLLWRQAHPYLLIDRLEDITNPEDVRVNSKCDRRVSLYGYIRGAHMRNKSRIHIAGCGDFAVNDITFLPDPCPLSAVGDDLAKKKTLDERERTIYAPFSGVGGIVYDKDAVYIDLGGSHHQSKGSQSKTKNQSEPSNEMVATMIDTEYALDEKIEESELRLFSKSEPLKSSEIQGAKSKLNVQEVVDQDGRTRNKINFDDDNEFDSDDNQSTDEEDCEEGENDESLEVGLSSKTETNSINEASQGNILKQSDDKIKPATLPKLKDRNKQLLREIGNDENDSDSEEDDQENEDSSLNLPQNIEISSTNLTQQNTEIPSVTQDKNRKHVAYHPEVTHRIKDVLSDLKHREKPLIGHGNDSGNESSESESDQESEIESEEDESESEEEENEMETMTPNNRKEATESELAIQDISWKADLARKASEAYYMRQSSTPSLRKLVYGMATNDALKPGFSDQDAQNDESDDEELGGMFKVMKQHQFKRDDQRLAMDQLDSTKFNVSNLQNWAEEEVRMNIKDCFVTGKWKQSEDAEELLKLDDEDDEVYGDFEDLETGITHDGKPKEEDEEEDNPRIVEDEKEVRRKKLEKKRQLKMKFDAEYDDKGGRTHLDELKKEVDSQTMINRSEFENLDDNLRIQYEGYRPGMYIRLEIECVPCELITNFDPSYPLIVGGLQSGEEQIGYIQLRMKKHRWYPKILKNRDPIIVSLGWRRFQTLPIYSVQDHNMRHRMIKYTPQHLHCDAHMWGPVTPQGECNLKL